MTGDVAFFFYGTLQRAFDSAMTRRLAGKLRFEGDARVRGRLYALGEPSGCYPGLVLDPAAGWVHGGVYAPTPDFRVEDLAALDAWEDVCGEGPQRGQHRRPTTRAVTLTSERAVQLYVCARAPAGGAPLIVDGRFDAWLVARGWAAWPGLSVSPPS